MYVQSLKIAGFMSFKDVTWNPERLNVLIGPNGSGKSNLLRALELIRASAAGNLRDFILGKGGFPCLLWGGLAEQMEFEIDTPACVYPFRLIAVPQSANFRTVFELLGFEHRSTPEPQFFIRRENELEVLDGNETLVHYPNTGLPETETALSTISVLWPHRARMFSSSISERGPSTTTCAWTSARRFGGQPSLEQSSGSLRMDRISFPF